MHASLSRSFLCKAVTIARFRGLGMKHVLTTASCLRKANGQTTTCPKETADLLVESFASVFTREKALNENCVLENMAEQINEFTVEKEEVITTAELVEQS